MDNITIARLLDETAALLEIDGADPFRVRSYRRAAEAVEQQTTQLQTLTADDADPKALLAIPGIGKGMAQNIHDLVATGTMPLRAELLTRYRPTMLELLRLPGMGPKTVALLWSALAIADMDKLEQAAKEGALLKLPRMGQKFTEKLLKGIADHRRNSGRLRIDQATEYADRISALIREFPGIDTITPAGSLRRGRETVGDLDLLATGPACEPGVVSAAVDFVASLPLIDKLLAKGQNKVSFTLRNNLQVDVRLLPEASYGAALQYFTGSKTHNVALRQRAIKRGLTLSEYALLRLEDNTIVAARTEEDIYAALGMDWIPPELRENCGELDAATNHTLPSLITRTDIRGDLHMHTVETDGAASIRDMAEAALARGLEYIAITDHSKNLAMTNGMDDRRALAHVQRIREIDREFADRHDGRFRVLAGIEVDILGDGSLDLEDSTLAEMDIVVASVHSRFDQPADEMTARIVRALENPHMRILGHPTGRKLLRRDPYAMHMDVVLRRAAQLGVAVEHNAAPARADLNDLHLRQAKEHGCKIVVDTDAHSTEELDQMRWGITQLRRAWLTRDDVLNTLPVDQFLAALRPEASGLNSERGFKAGVLFKVNNLLPWHSALNLSVAITATSGTDRGLPRQAAEPQSSVAAQAHPASLLHDYATLFKLRVSLMVIITAAAGFYLGSLRSGISPFHAGLAQAMLGIAAVTAGSSVLNQALERRTDALMRRTANRPMAAGRISFPHGLLLGFAAVALGSIYLAAVTNPLTGTLTLLTAAGYVAIYTPLKRITTLNTFIGAFPGALPPLIGWTAARGMIEWPAVALFAILFVWQFPHFMAIGWLYRDDYRNGGIRLTATQDSPTEAARSSVIQSLFYAVLMIPVSLWPVAQGVTGWPYAVTALVLGGGYLWYTIRFAAILRAPLSQHSRTLARNLLKASVIYLPLLLAAMILNAHGRVLF